MKKFKFRLQRVLDFKTVVKEEKLRVLMQATRRLNELKDHLEALQEAEKRNILAAELMSAREVHLSGLFSGGIQAMIVSARLSILDAEGEVEKAMADYIEAMKEEKSLTTLKDKKLQEYKDEALKEDIKFLDELAVQQEGHKHSKRE